MQVTVLAEKAKAASRQLAALSTETKNAALRAMADALEAEQDSVLAANVVDVDAARAAGTSESLIDRLTLNPARISAMAAGLRDVAALQDPIGEVVRGWQLANGVQVSQVRVPMGVIGMIYEARPNVTADAAGICLKTGNATLLRGSSSAINSNRAVVAALKIGLKSAGVSEDAVNLVEGGHESTHEMMAARGLIDLLIPRGGAGLISTVVNGSKVPVIETGTGNNHLFVEASADFELARRLILNAKVQRPSVCNALETLLVDASIAADFLPETVDQLIAAGVTIHGDSKSRAIDPRIVPGVEGIFDDEFLSLDLACKVVSGVEDALLHIQRHSSGHSETIVTNNLTAQRRFTADVDAAAVLVNTSSRFVDGGEFGFGAEIGISTQKLHARGPMALPEMTSTKYIVIGDGQVRS